MKKNSKTFAITFLVLLVSASFLSSCKKKDDNSDSNNNTTNQLTYDNQKYDLDKGTFIYFGGDTTDLMYYGFYLYSSGISFDEANYYTLIGNGDIIYFEVTTKESTGLPGSYPFNDDYDSETFLGVFGLTCTADLDECVTEADISAGTLVIETVGEETRLTFDCTDEYGKKVTGMFKGKMNYYDWSDENGTKQGTKMRRPKQVLSDSKNFRN